MTPRAPTTRRVRGAHGLELSVRDWDDREERCDGGAAASADAPPLFFAHGHLLDSHAWDFVAPGFASQRRVLALDSRGHGDSACDPEFRYHHAVGGMDILAVIDALAIESVDLVAHSTAGHAAIGLAARHPHRVHRLILVDAGPELRRAGRGGARPDTAPMDPVYPSADVYAGVLARRHPRARPEVVAHLARHGLRTRSAGGLEPKLDPLFTRPKSERDPANRRTYDRSAWAQRGEKNLWEDLAKVVCPTLVVRGGASTHLSAETARRMVGDVLRDGRAVEIPEAGHAVMLDRPEALADAIAAFVRS